MRRKESNKIRKKEYNITFEKRKNKSYIRTIMKAVGYIGVITILGYIFSEVRIMIEYGDTIKAVAESRSEGIVLNEYSKLVDSIEKSVVTITNEQNSSEESRASGVVVDSEGYIITSYSSIKKYAEIFVKIPYSESGYIRGNLVDTDEELDIAIIKIDENEDMHPIKIADTNSAYENQKVIVIGNITGEPGDEYASSGIVTNVSEIVEYKEYSYSKIETTAVVNEKNIGGVICNYNGELIGIALGTMSDEGFSYGVSINMLNVIVDRVNYVESLLGISEGGITAGGENDGFYIKELYKGGNAYKAGLEPTDIITTINNTEIYSVEDIIMVLKSKESGDVLDCGIIRRGEEINIKIKL